MENQLTAEHARSLTDTRGHADESPYSRINTLPVELLVEIFHQFVRDSHNDATGNRGIGYPKSHHQVPAYRKPDGDPIVLGTICKFWRTVALSIPGLWSTIFIATDHPHFPERLPLFVSRCRSEPLTLSLLLSRPPAQYRMNIQERLDYLHRYEELFSSIMSLVPRCKRLYLDLKWEVQSHRPTYTIPPLILEEFSANFSGTWDTRKITKFCSYLHASPCLKHIRWQGLRGNANSIVTHKLLESINPISVRDIELCDFHQFDGMFGLLSKYSNLETFACYVAKPPQASMALVIYGTNVAPAPPQLSTLSRLHTLSLLSVSSLDHVFGLVVLPNLSELVIDHCWDMESAGSSFMDIGWDSLVRLLERSQCRLRSLTYTRHGRHEDAPSIKETAFMRFLRSPWTQWLEELNVSAPVGDETLRALTPGGGRALICPKMTKVCFMECRSTDGAWSEMVASRSREGGKLERARVRLRGASESNFTRDLMLVVPGVDVDAQWRE